MAYIFDDAGDSSSSTSDDDLIFDMGNYDPTAYGNGWLDSTDYGYTYGGNWFGDSNTSTDPSLTPDPIDDYNYNYGGSYDWTTPAEEIPNTATKPGDVGYGWTYYSDGTAISPTGAYYNKGQLLYDATKPDSGVAGDIAKKVGDEAWNAIKGAFTKKNADGTESTDWRKVIGVGGAALGATGLLDGIGGLGGGKSNQPQGYQGGIPKYTSVRSAVPITGERPKAGDPGRRYFSDQIYATDANIAKAQADTFNQAQGLAALQQIEKKPLPSTTPATAPADKTEPTTGLATGGIAGLNVKNGMYLGGPTDGMADKLPATIDGNQEAALSHGEFVIPADVVGHLGNGNSEAGAERLYAMMDKIRMARTGNPKQGKQINPNKFLPA
jgi:hypothetical protein